MATPTPTKHGLSASQQGRTPSQSHGAAATPPVSTPFSAAHAAFSPHGPRSSPQQVKKSPATAATTVTATGGHSTNTAMNFDSPSAAAAFGALQIAASSMDINLHGLSGLGGLGVSTEDERARRLEGVINVISQSKGLVSEVGLERLAKRLGLECMWEDDMGSKTKRTLIVAGSALELDVHFSPRDIVESVALSFPDSAEVVNKHADEAGRILLDDLKLLPGQSPLTKKLDGFAANFERLATLDKLSVNPGLNLYEAVAGIYESLARLHRWELQKAREDPSLRPDRTDEYLQNLVLCTRSGKPAMNARSQVGLTIDYWREKRLQPTTSPDLSSWITKNEKIWSILIDCSPLRDMEVSPVRVSDKWISVDIEKPMMPDDLVVDGGPILDWLQPDNTYLPEEQDNKDASLLVSPPRLPEVAFHATFDPPVKISQFLWDHLRQMGCAPVSSSMNQHLRNFDDLLFPVASGSNYEPSETRLITATKKVAVIPRSGVDGGDGAGNWQLKIHTNKLYVFKPIYGRTLSEVTFSHPQNLISIMPYIRQYAFLSTLLEKSFGNVPGPESSQKREPGVGEEVHDTTKKNTTTRDDFDSFLTSSSNPNHRVSTFSSPVDTSTNSGGGGDITDKAKQGNPITEGEEPSVSIDVTLSFNPIPQLQIVFPLPGRAQEEPRSVKVQLEIRENGHVHVEYQNVLDDSNSLAPNGRMRQVEDIGKLLETVEDIGEWCEFLRTRWA